MGSTGKQFKEYLQSRNDLSEAEQDMLAANDFDRLEDVVQESTTSTPVTKQQVNTVENRVRTANTLEALAECEEDADKLLAGNVEDRVLVDRLYYIKRIINKKRLEIMKGVE